MSVSVHIHTVLWGGCVNAVWGACTYSSVAGEENTVLSVCACTCVCVCAHVQMHSHTLKRAFTHTGKGSGEVSVNLSFIPNNNINRQECDTHKALS